MSFVVGVRWTFRGKDATEDASIGTSGAARRHNLYSAEPS
jgi:hypothetical protein